MSHPLLKSLIESMIGNYLNESYEDDLVESIFEEVSEETWEAIEEAILNELSPKLLTRYKKKATAQSNKDFNTYDIQKRRSSALATQSSAAHRRDPGSGYELERQSQAAKDKALAADKRYNKRVAGIERAKKRLEK